MKDDRALIYPTLWKPTLTLGIPREFAICNILISAILSLPASLLIGSTGILFAFGIFAIGYLFALVHVHIDPDFFSIYLVKIFRIKATKNSLKGNKYVS